MTILDDEAAARLVTGFWYVVRLDLAAGCAETRAWLDTDDFTWWAEWTAPSVEPAVLRSALLKLVEASSRRKTRSVA